MTNTIYAVPGTFCNGKVWSELRKNLPSDIDLVDVEIPVKSSINEIVDCLDKQLPTEPSSLLGFSFGGYLIAAFALKYPHRVKKLLVVSDSLEKMPHEEITGRVKFASFIEKKGFSGLTQDSVAAVLHPSKKDDVDLHEKIVGMSLSMEAKVVQNQLLATTTRENIYEEFGRLTIPTYFVVGDLDKKVDRAIFHELTTKNHTLHYEEVSESGHYIPLEQSEKLAKVLIRWSEL
jgi:pimeloyl-ACP methyl ester carboxylesterase